MSTKTLSSKEIIGMPIFFIIGRPRSGTTLLRSLMDAHSNVIIPLEGPFMIKFYGKYQHIKNWKVEDIENLYNDLMLKNNMGFITMENWKVDKERLKKDLMDCVGENTFANICKVINGNYPCPEAKDPKLLGDKNPIYSNKLKFILKLYPEAKQIILTRDYRDHIQSMHKVDFGQIISPVLAYRWRKFIRDNKKLMNKYPDKFYWIKYEDLATDPRKYLKEITDFLGIPYEESMLDFYKSKKAVNERGATDIQEKYHQSLHNPISTKSIGTWKTTLSDQDVLFSDAVVGKYAELSGYERKYKKIPLLLRLKLIPVHIYMSLTEGLSNLFLKAYRPKTGSGVVGRGPVLVAKYWSIVNRK